MIDPTAVFIGIALLALVLPAVFLILIAIAANRRSHGQPVGEGLTSSLVLAGGLSLGVFYLVGGDPLISFPILAAAAFLVYSRWRAGNRRQAGWLLLGAALPWTLLWGLYVSAMQFGNQPFDPPSTWLGFLGGLVPTVAGGVVLRRGDPRKGRATATAAAGTGGQPLGLHVMPSSRSFGGIAAAIREPSSFGPFGLPEVAALLALFVTWVVIPLVLPLPGLPFASYALATLVGSVLATEAYLRAMPRRSRLAFEAFSWLGEWELARAKALTKRGVPTTARAARKWLAERPDRPEEAAVRIEVLVFVERFDDARALVDRMPDRTPVERFERAALLNLVDWFAGGDGHLEAMEDAAREILPSDGDDRLRAEVSIAAAKVRRRIDDQALAAEGAIPAGDADADSTPGTTEAVYAGDAVEPLIEVRAKLGSRADGQVGRALRKRLIPVFLITGLVFGVVFQLLSRV